MGDPCVSPRRLLFGVLCSCWFGTADIKSWNIAKNQRLLPILNHAADEDFKGLCDELLPLIILGISS